MTLQLSAVLADVTVPSWVTWEISLASLAIPVIGWIVFRGRTGNGWPAWLAAGFLAAWLGEAFVLSGMGSFLADPQKLVPNIAYAILLPMLLGYALFTWIRPLRAGVDAVPPHWIIGFQFYRALGFTFLVLFLQGRLPGAFALPAGIGDVAVGLAAPFVARRFARKESFARTLAIFWNWAGIVDLVVAVTCGVLTAPGRLQLLAHDAPNVLIGAFPLVLIPTIAVPFSIVLHVIGLRRLREAQV